MSSSSVHFFVNIHVGVDVGVHVRSLIKKFHLNLYFLKKCYNNIIFISSYGHKFDYSCLHFNKVPGNAPFQLVVLTGLVAFSTFICFT